MEKKSVEDLEWMVKHLTEKLKLTEMLLEQLRSFNEALIKEVNLPEKTQFHKSHIRKEGKVIYLNTMKELTKESK